MGLFNTFFSRSSERGNSKSSETRCSWTWVGRTQSGGVSLHPHKTDSPPEAASDELEATQPDSTVKEQVSKSQDRLKSEVTLPEYLKHGPEFENPTTHPTDSTVSKEAGVSSHISSTESKRSMRGSKGIAGFMTLLRSRKPRQQKSVFELSKTPGQHETYMRGKSSDWGNSNNRDNEKSVNQRSDLGQILQFNGNLNEDPESRKVSDKTVQSVDSDLTNVTVCRRPSKRTSTPIAIVDREYVSKNPFDDLLEASNSVTNNPFTDQSRINGRSSRQPSSSYSDTSSLSVRHPVNTERSRIPITQNGSFPIGSLLRESSFPTSSSNESTWSSHIDQQKATIAFNELASKLHLDPLILSDSDDEGVEVGHAHPFAASYDSAEERLPRRRDRIFGRIRTMRSTIHIRTQPVPQDRTLRRMKTFAGLSSRSCGMDSLKGKPLETLARLGGHSLLALPGDFAPSSLKLPVCFVATATYLRCCAPPVRHLFVDPGDLKTATRTYEYFASQVLSAEKEQDKIQMTMRSSEMSSDLMGILNLNASGRSSTRVLSVAWAFKALLAGLPGGILGSMRLYHVLVNIYNRRISECQLKRTKSCL